MQLDRCRSDVSSKILLNIKTLLLRKELLKRYVVEWREAGERLGHSLRGRVRGQHTLSRSTLNSDPCLQLIRLEEGSVLFSRSVADPCTPRAIPLIPRYNGFLVDSLSQTHFLILPAPEHSSALLS